jgi:hypothetical protein
MSDAKYQLPFAMALVPEKAELTLAVTVVAFV